MEEELNKKIAEWCGFRETEFVGDLGRWKDDIKEKWYYPNSERLWFLPDFTSSLDALFQYVVPKLFRNFPYKQVYMLLLRCLTEYTDYVDTPDEKDFAPIICKAVEKLIDNS